mmetsp:Transcript_13762/g.52417  ORF Transcript_13762/g.52417 Transcript_13762/m.52417 type:complete len:224 (-) Transcript_13762:203-874(-)
MRASRRMPRRPIVWTMVATVATTSGTAARQRLRRTRRLGRPRSRRVVRLSLQRQPRLLRPCPPPVAQRALLNRLRSLLASRKGLTWRWTWATGGAPAAAPTGSSGSGPRKSPRRSTGCSSAPTGEGRACRRTCQRRASGWLGQGGCWRCSGPCCSGTSRYLVQPRPLCGAIGWTSRAAGGTVQRWASRPRPPWGRQPGSDPQWLSRPRTARPQAELRESPCSG